MSTHTPGPWGWIEKNGNAFLIQANDDEAKEYPGLKCIADDGSAYGEYGRKIEPDSADAKLIAAAPDLLEALEQFVDLGIEEESLEAWPELGKALSSARSAIDKAKGKKQ